MILQTVTLFRRPSIEWFTASTLGCRDTEFEGPGMDSIDEPDAQQIARALGDPTRFDIYRHLAEMKEIRCGDICLGTPVRASTVSHHLKVLSDAGLIESRREGQGVYYRAVPERLRAYLSYLHNMAQTKQSLQRGSSLRTPRQGWQ